MDSQNSGPAHDPVARQRGPFFYGFLTISVFLILAGTGALFGIYKAYQILVHEYTAETPISLPTLNISEEEARVALRKSAVFSAGLRSTGPVSSLVLDTKDFYGIISQNPAPEISGLRDKIFISLSDDKLRCQLSYPLGRNKWVDLSGRYLNADASVKISLEHGVLIVTLEDLKLSDKTLPENILQNLKKHNLAKELYENVEAAAAIRKLDTIRIMDGRMEIKARAGNESQ